MPLCSFVNEFHSGNAVADATIHVIKSHPAILIHSRQLCNSENLREFHGIAMAEKPQIEHITELHPWPNI